MADEELRALARAVEARPDDVEAAWAHARALARVGDRRGEHRALAALARRGDEAARAAVEGWTPWGGVGGGTSAGRGRRSTARPLLAAPRQVREVALPFAGALLAAVSHEVLVVIAPDAVAAFGVTDLEERWRLPAAGPQRRVGLVGDDVLVASGDVLQLVEGSSGRVLQRERALAAHAQELVVVGDRALARVASPDRRASHGLVLLDVGASFGRTLWSRDDRAPFSMFAAGAVAVVEHHAGAAGLEGIELAGGRGLWTKRRFDAGTGAATMLAVLGADAAGVVVAGAEAPASERVLLDLDPASGELRWRVADPQTTGLHRRPLALGEELLLLAVGQDRLAAVERRGGRVRWLVEDRCDALLLAGDVAYLVSGDAASVTARALDDGRRLFQHPLPGLEAGLAGSRVAPVEGGLVALVRGRLVRLD